MIEYNYSPPALPTANQQLCALQQGLGRALQWAHEGKLDLDLLIYGCLEDQRYDLLCEDERSDWLWQIVQAANAVDSLREPLLRSMTGVPHECSAEQLCGLAFHYAKTENQDFLKAFYDLIARRTETDDPYVGEDVLLRLDGQAAFEFLTKLHGERLCSTEWEWHDHNLIELASKTLGLTVVESLLQHSTDAGTQKFYECWLQQKAQRTDRSKSGSRAELLQAIPACEVIEAAKADRKGFSYRGWGMHAEASELAVVYERIFVETEVSVIARLLKVFSNRETPFDHRLIEYCHHENPDVRFRTLAVLRNMRHPSVREYALKRLQSDSKDYRVISLFEKNYQPGDEDLIFSTIQVPEEVELTHSLWFNVLDVLIANLTADCRKLGIAGYAETPCEICRYHYSKLLLNRHELPNWMAEEIRYDSYETTRQLYKVHL